MSKLIKGAKGGGKGGSSGSARVAVESPDNLRSIQYANVLDLISEGEIEGLVDGAKSVYLDDTPLQNSDGTYNFQGVTISSRNGTQSQNHIAGFGGAEAESGVGIEIKQSSPATRSITNSNNTAVRVTLSVPQLTQQNTTNGDITGASVDLAIDIQTDGGGFIAQEMRRVWSSSFSTDANGYVKNTITAKQFQIGVNWTGLVDTSYQNISFKLQYRSVGSSTWIDYANHSLTGKGSIQQRQNNNSGFIWYQSYTYITVPPRLSTTFNLLFSDGFYEFRVVKLSGSGTVSIGTSQAYSPVYYDTISGKTTSKYQRSYRIELPVGSEWDIRVRRITADSAALSLQNKTFWDSYTEIIDAKLTYPNSALVGMQIDAKQFDRIPVRGFEIKGLKVKIPSNYNPLTRAYAGTWDGTFTVAWTDNPAWVFYDIVTNDRYGLGDMISESMVDKWGLYSIAQYCDALVEDGFGGYEPRFTCNLYIQAREQAYQVITNIASIFRSMVYWSAGSVQVSQDAPKDVSQIFSAANVIDGVFNYSGSSVKVRHTVAMISWNDPQDNYLPKIEYVADNEAIARYGVVQTELVAIGCTSRGQANRIGKWLLYSEQYETETITFKAGLDSVFIQAGDVIQTTDANRAGKRMGGRLIAADVYNVTLDAAITIETGKTYEISCRLADGTVETRNIINGIGTHTLIDLDAAFSTVPQIYAMWIISVNDLVAESWRVVSISEIEKTQVEIIALSYRAEKYAAVEQGIILEALPTSIINTSQPNMPSNITVIESLYLAGAGVVGVVATVSWDSQPGISNYVLVYNMANQNPVTITTTDNTVDIKPLDEGRYTLSIYAQNSLGRRSQAQVVVVDILGKTLPPEDVQNFALSPLGSIGLFTWSPATDLDVIVGGKVYFRFSPNLSATWETAQDLVNEASGSATTITLPLQSGIYFAKFIDSSGNESTAATSITTDVAHVLALNFVEALQAQPLWTGLKANTQYSDDLTGLILSSADLWDAAEFIDSAELVDFGLPGVSSTGSYALGAVDLGEVQTCRISTLIEARGIDISFTWDSDEFVDSLEFVDGDIVSDAIAVIWYRATNDNPLGAPVWSAWQSSTLADVSARAFEFELRMATASTYHNVIVTKAEAIIDMPDRIESGDNIASGTTAKTITYTKPFIISPALGLSAENMQTGDFYTLSSKTNAGFTIQFFDIGSNPVNRIFDYIAKAY